MDDPQGTDTAAWRDVGKGTRRPDTLSLLVGVGVFADETRR